MVQRMHVKVLLTLISLECHRQSHVFMWNAQNNITAPEEPNFGALGLMNNLRDEVLGTELLFKAGNVSW